MLRLRSESVINRMSIPLFDYKRMGRYLSERFLVRSLTPSKFWSRRPKGHHDPSRPHPVPLRAAVLQVAHVPDHFR